MTDEFNTILLNILNFIYKKSNNIKIRKYYLIINNSLEEDENKKKFIEQFILKGLQYKEQILNKNENFFLELQFETDLFTHKEINNFKQIYLSLDKSDRDLIIDNVIQMTILSENYLAQYIASSS
jgi:hypothetical protein